MSNFRRYLTRSRYRVETQRPPIWEWYLVIIATVFSLGPLLVLLLFDALR